MSIGVMLKELRIRRELTQSQVAKDLSISQNTLSQYESESRQPDLNMLSRIAKYYRVSTDFLLNERFDFYDPSILTLEQNLSIYKDDIIELKLILDKTEESKISEYHIEKINELIDRIDFIYEHSLMVELEEMKNIARKWMG